MGVQPVARAHASVCLSTYFVSNLRVLCASGALVSAVVSEPLGRGLPPTPGRLAAMLGTIVGLHHVQLVALDEADALADRAQPVAGFTAASFVGASPP